MRDNGKSAGGSLPQKEQPRKFNKGDVVQYVEGKAVRKSNSGKVVESGQKMTVGHPGPINLGGYVGAVRIPDNYVDMVGCTWTAANGKAELAKFLESELLLLGA